MFYLIHFVIQQNFLRYIDDVIFTWNEPITKLELCLRQLNDVHPNIKLVYQYGLKFSFLDLNVENRDGQLLTTVHHKDAAEPYIVPYMSDHPQHIFSNIINCGLQRAIRYSSTFDSFNNERRIIRLKLLYNGYVIFSIFIANLRKHIFHILSYEVIQ